MKVRINFCQRAGYSLAISAMFVSVGAYAAHESGAHKSGGHSPGQAAEQSIEETAKKGVDQLRGKGGQSGQSGQSKHAGHGGQSGMRMSSKEISQVQSKLNQEGYSVGIPDGVMGRKTAQALSQYQRDQGHPATGKLDQRTLASLGVGMAGTKGTERQHK